MMTATTENAKGAGPEADAQQEIGVRAVLYGVLSHLFADRPQAALLHRIAAAGTMIEAEDSVLAQEWRALCAAAGAADQSAVAAEFDALFVSTGLPPVSLYASSYMSGRQGGQLIAELREELGRVGYTRTEDSNEYEDHLAALCDVMRGLISEESVSELAIERQQVFFQGYVEPWYGRLFGKIDAAENTRFYRDVARFANAFFTHESQYFELA